MYWIQHKSKFDSLKNKILILFLPQDILDSQVTPE